MTTTTSSATTTCKTTTMSSSIVSTTSSSTVSTSSSIAATTAPVTKLATTTTKAVTTNTSSATITFKTTATSSSIVSTTSRSTVSTSSSIATTTAPVTAPRPTTPTTCANKPYTPYYAALSNGYTTDPALAATRTTTAGQACPTIPEKGTYCGFINPLDPCAPQPDGYGPIPFPDNPSAFLAFPTLHALASAAPSTIPSTDNTEYIQVFKDLNAATSAPSYLGLYTLQNYSAPECAAKCDCTELCTAFNIYAERDPSLNPANNDSTYNPGYQTVWGQNCPNPQSMTSYKCTLWGSHIDSSTATNTGYTTEQFQVVVTASDGYDKIDITIPTKVNPNLTTL
ncbi:hypothetical protein DOTSEDRAFT_157604 [Dothistroma septosporum NZE10]|uniref:Uncharacterized protein n=1 Tax=Dothistroma septosporum (strain NZE10 / CBS 128990) TaxID=675120 RepID=N1PGT0_DOTSN|nr:hypothetical protein DOTSEDRAFT_157604 [Dothistroma septosporum NZE10]